MAHISPSKRGVKKRPDARVERTRDALRNALLRLVETKSFDGITIRDISAEAGTGYASFFRHYPDKAALLDDLAATAIAELLGRALPILEAVDTRASCFELCRYVDERRNLWSALLTGGAAANLKAEFIRQARKVAAARAKPDSWLPADLAVVSGVSGTLEILAWWLQHRRQLSRDQVADILDRLVISPILRT
jgi:AcrR family transcriptional regulator